MKVVVEDGEREHMPIGRQTYFIDGVTSYLKTLEFPLFTDFVYRYDILTEVRKRTREARLEVQRHGGPWWCSG